MSKSSHLELHDNDSDVALGHLDSVSLPSEPPDIRSWFSSYVYESPDIDALGGFQDFNGDRENRPEEEIDEKSGNNHRVSDYDDACAAAELKLSHEIQSESLSFSAEPPDIRNWFSSYIYESLLLDSACDFAISYNDDMEDGKLYVGENSSSRNRKPPMASIDVEETEPCTQMDTLDSEVKGPHLVEDVKLYHQSVFKENGDVDLQPLSSAPSLLSSDKVSDPMLSEQRAVHNSHYSLERNGSSLYPASVNMKNNKSSRVGKPVHSSVEGSERIGDFPNKDIYTTASPRAIDRIVAKGDSCGTAADRISIEETELPEDGFISVRKRSCRANDENTASFIKGVKPMINHEKDSHIVRKVLSEISNSQYQDMVGSTGKWSCPQKSKPENGPPLKQLRLDQWVRRVRINIFFLSWGIFREVRVQTRILKISSSLHASLYASGV